MDRIRSATGTAIPCAAGGLAPGSAVAFGFGFGFGYGLGFGFAGPELRGPV